MIPPFVSREMAAIFQCRLLGRETDMADLVGNVWSRV